MTVLITFSRGDRVMLRPDYMDAPRSHRHAAGNTAAAEFLTPGSVYTVENLYGHDGTAGRSIDLVGTRGLFNSNQFVFAEVIPPPIPPMGDSPFVRMADAGAVFDPAGYYTPPPRPSSGMGYVSQDSGASANRPLQVGDVVRRRVGSGVFVLDMGGGDRIRIEPGGEYIITSFDNSRDHIRVGGATRGGASIRSFELVTAVEDVSEEGASPTVSAPQPPLPANPERLFVFVCVGPSPYTSSLYTSRELCAEVAQTYNNPEGHPIHVLETTSTLRTDVIGV